MNWRWALLGGLALVMIGGAVTTAVAYSGGKELGKITLIMIDGKPVEQQTGKQFLAMRAAALRDGVKLVLNSGFRTWAEQVRLYGLYLAGQGNLAAKPGFSNHQSGLAVDIQVDNSFTSPVYRWLAANAARYGFVNTGKSFSQPEPWHWERKQIVAV